MKAFVSSIALLIGLVAASSAHAGATTLAVADVSIEVPKKWTVEDSGDQLTLTPKDQSCAITVTHVAGTRMDDAWAGASGKASELLGSALGDRMDAAFGNLSGYVATGAGSMSGLSVEALVAVLYTPRNNMIAVVVLGEVGKYEKHEKAFTKALQSLKGGAPAINDEGYYQLSAEAQKIADKVVKIIEKNDTKAYLKLVDGSKHSSIFVGGEGGIEYTKKTLTKAFKKQKKIVKVLDLPATGAWHVMVDSATSFHLWRGAWEDYVMRLHVHSYDGAWYIGDSVAHDMNGAADNEIPEEDM